MTASLWHPHIVGAHDRGEFDGRLWISMDFVDGTDAAHLLADSGALPVMDVAAIVDAIADALDFARQRGLLHRDVKASQHSDDRGRPSAANLARGLRYWPRDRPYQRIDSDQHDGRSYAAPEQLMGESLDGRAD